MNSLLVRIAPRFFKPSLAHSKRSIRFMALKRLDLQDPVQQAHFLEWLEKEKDSQLIQEALPLFPDLQPLVQLLDKELPSALHTPLMQHISKALLDPDLPALTGQTLLAATHNTPLLLNIISTAEEQNLRLQAIDQLQAEENDWLEIALSNSMARVRYQAATRIHTEASLEQLVKEALGDKKVQRLARDRLAELKAQQQAKEQALEQQEKLVKELEQQLNSQDLPLFAARLEHLERQWSQLAAFPAPPSLEKNYQQLLEKAQQKAQQLAEQERSLKLAKERQEQVRQLADQLLEKLNQLNTQAVNQLSSDGASIQEALDQLQADWSQNNLHQEASSSQKKHWQEHTQTLEKHLSSWQTFNEQLPALQILLTESEWSNQQLKAAQKLLDLINWPTHFQAPTEIQEIHTLLKELQKQPVAAPSPQQTFNDKDCLNKLKRLENLLDEGNSRDAQKVMQQLQELMAQAPAGFRDQQAAYFSRLSARFAELKDWQGFVAAPKRETLCEQMEALAEDKSMQPAAKAERIQALQQEWKELGSAAMNKALWKRFKAAADLAYLPCKAWFAEQARLREYNQDQRRIICEELEKLVSSEQHLALDEDALDSLMTKVHDEWRRFNPVNRAEGKRLAERFQKALKPIKDHLYQLRQQHAENKRSLIQAAKALLEEENLRTATATSKKLQEQWRQLGKAPGSLEHQLWKEFRSACDQLFERRDQQHSQQLQEQQANLILAREHLEAAEQALQNKDLDAATASYQQALQVGQLPRQEKNGWEKQLQAFKQALQQAQATQKNQALLNQFSERWQQLADTPLSEQDSSQARQLVLQLENLAGVPAAAEDQALRMQLQVERLNAGIKGEATPQGKTQEAIALFDTWEATLGSREGPLADRFIQAFEQLFKN